MNRVFVYLLLVLLLASCTSNKRLTELNLINIYEVETNEQLEPSGLTYWDGEFYTVSDKNNYIYRLIFDQKKVRLEPYIKIINESDKRLDFEGISHDENNFYLVSENQFKILVVSKDGTKQHWLNISPSLEEIAKQAGLFKTRNAYLEGVCVYQENNKLNFILVAERQPRGFIQFSLNKNNKISSFSAFKSTQKNYQKDRPQSADFSGLSCSGQNQLYVLNRNSYTVVKLRRVADKFIEVFGWSYKNIINQPRYQFEDMEFGLAEGLYVDKDKVYIILDNNKDHRKNDPSNKNSLFIELSK